MNPWMRRMKGDLTLADAIIDFALLITGLGCFNLVNSDGQRPCGNGYGSLGVGQSYICAKQAGTVKAFAFMCCSGAPSGHILTRARRWDICPRLVVLALTCIYGV
jgi:hypothetical protein